MRRANCRCGQALTAPGDGVERVVCPKCGARVRFRPRTRDVSAPAAAQPEDGYIRFLCPCGRRLKIQAVNPPSHGKCPDCGRVVPVPSSPTPSASALPAGHRETPTRDLDAADLELLERWSQSHLKRTGNRMADSGDRPGEAASPPPTAVKSEAGLRVCPGCGKPVHLGAETCRHCGTHVPKR